MKEKQQVKFVATIYNYFRKIPKHYPGRVTKPYH